MTDELTAIVNEVVNMAMHSEAVTGDEFTANSQLLGAVINAYDQLRQIDSKNELNGLVYHIGGHLFKTSSFDEKYGGVEVEMALKQYHNSLVENIQEIKNKN